MLIYTQLTSEQRYQIQALLKAECSQTEIARVLNVHKSTISRELRRNRGRRGYRPRQAQILCDQPKQGKYKGTFSACDWHLVEHLIAEEQLCIPVKVINHSGSKRSAPDSNALQ